MKKSRLTPLQNNFLEAFFHRDRRFFLTGGAALSGFYLGHRETQDLDLFTLQDVLDEGVAEVFEIAGQLQCSAPVESGRRSVRLMSDTGLPWTVVVADSGSPVETEPFASRRRLLLAGLALAAVLVVTTGYALARSLSRELEVARLKSDFVAAVSHEFRTPLATLRQLTENLAGGRVSTDERRSAYYRTQRRATSRLSRLVERLLDFGRMEAGALRYQFESIDIGRLTSDVVAGLRKRGIIIHDRQFSHDATLALLSGN